MLILMKCSAIATSSGTLALAAFSYRNSTLAGVKCYAYHRQHCHCVIHNTRKVHTRTMNAIIAANYHINAHKV